jgi:prepilin-type N-terminal cleavage/methylation domain-containing protein
MIFGKVSRLINGQKGFTLIEVITALAITGLIGIGASTATVQVLNQGTRNSDYTTASRHAMNTIYWVSRDAQMSQTIEPEGASGFPLTLSWTAWDNSQHQVTYSIEGDKLSRSYSIDGGVPSQTLVAQYINSAAENTTCDFAGGVLTLKVTATVGDGAHAISVTKERQITPRPGL